MTDLISTPPAPASPAGSKVETGPWWPDIDVNAVRAQVNLGGTTIAHERLFAAITQGALQTMRELADWQVAQIANGKANLAAVDPDNMIGGQPVLVVEFLRAVAMSAAAELADGHLDLTATQEGTDRAESRMEMADRFRRAAVHAIRAITGQTGALVDLV